MQHMSRRGFAQLAGGAIAAGLLAGCAGTKAQTNETTPADEAGINYQVLVNKQHELPDGWVDALDLKHFDCSEGWEVTIEAKTYEAWLQLKEALEADDVYVDLDNAYRGVEEQQEIWDDFIKQYGEEYTKLYVSKPGYSEHHTGLAIDLYLIIDGTAVVYNEDMVKYPEVWEKVHARAADYGFILRYLPGKKIETGYSYEPWHLRYLGDVELAHKIMDEGLTYEAYLGEVEPAVAGCVCDYGTSELYTEADMDSALEVILSQFRQWAGCVMRRFAFAGDDACGKEELAYLNELREANDDTAKLDAFDQCIVFETDFHTPAEEGETQLTLEPDTDYEGYTWHLGRTGADGAWRLLTFGYA